MRPIHMALVLAALVAVFVAVLAMLGGGAFVLAAGPDGGRASLEGVGPGGDLAVEGEGTGAESASSATRSAIAVEEPAVVGSKPAPRAKPVVRGRVVDPEGRGVAGARVWISSSEFWARIPLDLEAEALPARWLEVARAECDAEGRFEFADLAPGRLRLVARAAGFAPSYREDLGFLREGDVALPDVALGPGVAVAGIVLGPDGKPAAGVRVLIAADSLVRGGGIEVPGRGVPAGETAADGSFRVDELAPGPFHLLFLAEGLALADLVGRTERAGEERTGLVVRLEPGVEIAGRVVPEAGTSLPAELRVVARSTAAGDQVEDEEEPEAPVSAADSAESEARPRTALVAADGAFRVAGLRAGATYRLSVGERRGTSWKAAGSTPARDQRAPAGGLEIVYKPETAIRLRAVDDATSLPIEDLVVWAGIGRFRPLRDEKNQVQRAFPQGAVRYGELRVQPNAKPAWLRVSAPGYQDHERKDLRLVAGAELDLGEVRLKPERRVVVTVVDDAGQPVADARVIATEESEARLREWSRSPASADLWGEIGARFGRTGPEGHCAISSLPGKNVLVQASARGYVPCEPVAVLLPKDADHALTLKLERGARVVVRVRDGTGRAVAGVPVGHRLPRDSAAEGEDQYDENVVTDAGGESRFEALESGVHAFRVQQEDGESAWWAEDGEAEAREEPWQEVTLANAADVTLSLVAPPRGTLLGVVREGGVPLEGALVKLVPYVEGRESGWTWGGNGLDPFSSTTDHRGEYRIENRRAGEYVVLVHHPERRMPTEFRVLLGSGEQVRDFALDLNGIEGRVTDPDGLPLAGVRIGISRAEAGIEMEPPHSMVLREDDRGNPNVEWRQGRGNRGVRTDAQGRYVLRGLVENTGLHVHCQGDEFENRSSDAITLAPGEIRRGVDFALRRAGRLRVELLGNIADDRWFEVSVVSRRDERETVVRQLWLANWNRSETIGSVVPGSYVLRLAMRDEQGGETRIAETPVEVEVGRVARAVFQVP